MLHIFSCTIYEYIIRKWPTVFKAPREHTHMKHFQIQIIERKIYYNCSSIILMSNYLYGKIESKKKTNALP